MYIVHHRLKTDLQKKFTITSIPQKIDIMTTRQYILLQL